MIPCVFPQIGNGRLARCVFYFLYFLEVSSRATRGEKFCPTQRSCGGGKVFSIQPTARRSPAAASMELLFVQEHTLVTRPVDKLRDRSSLDAYCVWKCCRNHCSVFFFRCGAIPSRSLLDFAFDCLFFYLFIFFCHKCKSSWCVRACICAFK